jgi:hypothetical protein
VGDGKFHIEESEKSANNIYRSGRSIYVADGLFRPHMFWSYVMLGLSNSVFIYNQLLADDKLIKIPDVNKRRQP